MDDMHNKAKKEQIAALRKIMQELIAESGGDTAMGSGELEEALGDAADTAKSEGDDLAMDADEAGDGDEMPMDDEEEESPLQKMKREYFKPESKPPRPGTAVMMAQMETKKPMGKPMRKGRFA